MALLTGPVGFFGDTTTVYTSAVHKLGSRAFDIDGNEYIFLTGVASTAAGSVVVYDTSDYTTILAVNQATSATCIGSVAVASAATVASTYGWYMIRGKATAAVLASFADNSKVFTTTTAGSVDDSGTAGDQIVGMTGRSAISSGTATLELMYPVTGVNVA